MDTGYSRYIHHPVHQGLEEQSMSYVWEARKMAEFMRLFGTSIETFINDEFGPLESEQKRWLGQVAWGTFDWQAYVSIMRFTARIN